MATKQTTARNPGKSNKTRAPAKSKATTINPQPVGFVKVEDVMELLQVSRSTAYHTMQTLNKELKAKGKIVRAGRVPLSYLMERCGL